jgi:cell division protein FtsL
MAPGFQSSFIPKGPDTQQVFQKKKAGVLGVLIVSLFVFILILSVGMVFYKNMVKTDIENLKSQLATAGQSIDKKSIDEMARYSQKLSIVKSIVLKHQVISGFLNSLASSTISTVSFSEFNYDGLSSGGITVRMRGSANSYGSIALQENVFSKNKYWNSTKFSNLALGNKGTVNFEVEVSVDPEIVVYSPELPASISAVNKDDQSLSAGDELDGLDGINLDLDNL